MNKLTLRDVDVSGKRVLTRVDFNVPIKSGVVGDDTRIRAALPTIQYVLEHQGKLILMSHLGRPEGEAKPEFSLKPVALHLERLLGKPVKFVADCVGTEVEKQVEALKPGEVILLENVRYHAEEELLNKYTKQDSATQKKIDEFVSALARLGDLYVNDAFGTAHRAHGSTAGVTKHFKQNVAGFLMEKEIEYLSKAVSSPERPFIAILGGAKVSDKIGVLTNLVEKVDALIIGGAMAYTFLKVQGKPVGTSRVEEEQLNVAKEILEKAKGRGVSVLLPVDHAVAPKFDVAEPEAIVDQIPDGQMGLDIGPKSIELFQKEIAKAKTVIWNGPMGVFEKEGFAKGTVGIAKALAESKAVTIIGGGDSVAAVNQAGVADKMTHISTGGGASLELLEGKKLPGVVALTDR